MAQRKPEWSNVPEDMDTEMRTPTPHEQKLEKLAEENKKIPPQRYNITSKNPKAMRVIHDFDGQQVTINPLEAKLGVLLQPHIAQYLGRGDLEVVSAGA